MRSGSELGLILLLGALGCERERPAPTEGAARPLVLGSASASAAPARTAPPGMSCVPGTHRCAGDKLESCDASARGFVQVNVCQTAAHCNAKLGQCLVDPCILGEHQCHGADLEQCHANGWTRVRQCDSQEACNAERGRCE
ncbi:MAG: hypothetical protein IPM35_31235 [Myxococcales bacterium]|nr:hypothetical protein [Myxococcales bacterium]